jgi:hypothetical protein
VSALWSDDGLGNAAGTRGLCQQPGWSCQSQISSGVVASTGGLYDVPLDRRDMMGVGHAEKLQELARLHRRAIFAKILAEAEAAALAEKYIGIWV